MDKDPALTILVGPANALPGRFRQSVGILIHTLPAVVATCLIHSDLSVVGATYSSAQIYEPEVISGQTFGQQQWQKTSIRLNWQTETRRRPSIDPDLHE
jgi:hypothetical protein